jgi:hypothetical protein
LTAISFYIMLPEKELFCIVKIRSTGYVSAMDEISYDTNQPGHPLLFDTDDVLYAQLDADDANYTAIVMKERGLVFYIQMAFDAYAAIVLAGVEHLSTYGQMAG